jgi:hypothetical protein
MKLVRFALTLAFACSILSGSHALAQGEAEAAQ